MKDLTQGSIPKHVIEMAVPIAIGMLVQTLYYLVDLYFVGRLGDVALAGVSTAGNAMFLVLALSQMLGVGTVALISHAVGRKDRDDANLVFNQSLVLAASLAVTTLVAGYALVGVYLDAIAADAATRAAGKTYLHWFMPGMALQFALVAMSSALRGTGIVKPTMMVQMLTVLINAILAPVLIAGLGTGRPLGVAGAGLATTLSVSAGVVLLWLYFTRLEKYVTLDRHAFWPRPSVWRRMLGIGFPAGAEFILMFAIVTVTYWAIRDFGTPAQAGYGLGTRIMHAIFLPAMALAFAAPAVAGQNFGARLPERVRWTFRWTAMMSGVVMLSLTLLCQISPSLLVRHFSTDQEAIAVAATYLRYISFNFVANALVFTCSGLFQAVGNTWPSLLSSTSRILTFALPVIWISQWEGFVIEDVWRVSIASVALQAVLSFFLLQRELGRRLSVAPRATDALQDPSPSVESPAAGS